MRYNYNFLPIGTRIVTKQRATIGYILGNAHFRNNIYRKKPTDPNMVIYYLIYFPDTNIRRYLNNRQFTIIESPTDESTTFAITHLPLIVNPKDILSDTTVPIGGANFQIGDWVSTELFGTGIIISDGFYRPGSDHPNIYHHIYFPETGVFEFERERYCSLVRPATEQSSRQAIQIIQNQIIKPTISKL